MTQGIALPKRLSYSSLNGYTECGERWKLERGYGIRPSTWFATVAGSAIHEITELHDIAQYRAERGDNSVVTITSFRSVFDKLLAKEKEKGVEVKPSGRKLTKVSDAGGPNKKDYDWWLEYGPIMVQRWLDWRASTDWFLATMPDGSPGIEVAVRAPFGGREHLGFIDRVYITPNGEIVIVDLKTGAVPVSSLQLGVYAVGLERDHGLLVQWGTYWMAKDGELTPLKDLTRYTPEWIDAQYEMAWKGINAGVFLPNVTSMCAGCGVRDFCRAVGGMRADEIPARDVLIPAAVPESPAVFSDPSV